MEMTLYVLAQLGVAVFAISGCIAAGRSGMDWVGVLALAFATGLGGGTLRDVLLNQRVFWIEDTTYLWVILFTSFATIGYVRFFRLPEKALRIADALGLALFAIIGAQIAEATGAAPIIIVLMGVTTGAAGGVIRDVLSNVTPLLFRSPEPLYSVAALAGCVGYLLLQWAGMEQFNAAIIGMLCIALIRLLAIAKNICLPEFHVGDR
jgi:uncharacterized membrane protein YeiH